MGDRIWVAIGFEMGWEEGDDMHMHI